MSNTKTESDYESTEPRRDIHIEREQHDMFTELQESENSPLYQAENHEIFVFCVGYGRKYAMRQTTNDELAFFGRSRLSDTQQAIIEAVAVEEERNPQVLRDQRSVYRIAEEYANAGVEEVYNRVFGPKDEDPLSELTLEIKEEWEEQ
ncbi:hypothetical protein RBH20_20150 [Haloarcula sp. H-GB4]|jgi:hypothetical protein|uniref:hypothetical protein n=1 Tax=Haloarcula sp. H-GB4 TaxID=3069755 RepID=UPI0027B1C5E7|nr:hypothetical protein [Haloarcula sp. H-GB4]MDQ2074839.1 hypothetical protein [Haloarcula sp. H-GB4]